MSKSLAVSRCNTDPRRLMHTKTISIGSIMAGILCTIRIVPTLSSVHSTDPAGSLRSIHIKGGTTYDSFYKRRKIMTMMFRMLLHNITNQHNDTAPPIASGSQCGSG